MPVPVQTPPGVTVTAVSAGYYSWAVVGDDGNAYTWGANGSGELGDGTNTYSIVPVQVQAPAGVAFTAISTGYNASLALGDDGNAYGWGANHSGQLGTGNSANSNVPVQMLAPEVVVTGVTFDGLPGTDLVDNGDGTVTVTTPAHAAGPVDVVLSWTLGGVTQTPVAYPGGFIYLAPAIAPTITDPDGQTVAATGTPDAVVTWEVSTDGGKTWAPITAGVSADGLTLTVAPALISDSGNRYRSTATNRAGSATSAAATLTVTTAAANGDDATKKADVDIRLSRTGTESTPLFWIAGLAALLAGAGLITVNRLLRRRVNS